jgi:hypothetical protein
MSPKTASLLLLMLCAACGGGGGGGSTPSTPSSPSPTIPVSSACTAVGQASSSTAIVNGVECSSANSPVVLLNMKDDRGQQAGSCTGTVIAPRAILTAAHCFPAAAASVKVFLGTGAELTATSFAGFPGYKDGDGTTRDVGVVLMGQDIGRTPVPLLLSRDARVGENAILVGWGKGSISLPASTLRAGVTTISAVSALVLQTAFSDAFSSVCQGDSGGPILLSEGGVWSIGGVISANETLACSFGDNFYANIRHPDINTFILNRVPDAARR